MSESNKKLLFLVIVCAIMFWMIAWIIFVNTGSALNEETAELIDNMTYFKDYNLEMYPSGTLSPDDIKEYDYIIYNGWGPWCSSCVKEMPDLNTLYGKYKDRGVLIVGIVADYSEQIKNDASYYDKVGNVVNSYGIEYPIILCDNKFIVEVYPTMQSSFPTTWVVDKDGNLVDYFIGAKSESDWAKLFEDLAQKAEGNK